jgi:hypothetical protein
VDTNLDNAGTLHDAVVFRLEHPAAGDVSALGNNESLEEF